MMYSQQGGLQNKIGQRQLRHVKPDLGYKEGKTQISVFFGFVNYR